MAAPLPANDYRHIEGDSRRVYSGLKPTPPDGTSDGMDTWQTTVESRLAELKEAVVGLRHSQNIVLASMAILVAVTLGGFALVVQRIDRVEDKLDGMPAELRGIADSIAQAITATRAADQRPIIIQVPAAPEPGAPPQK